MTGRLAHKKVLITGAGQGLGAASARLMAREGAHLLLTDIDGAAAAAQAEAINSEFGAGTAFSATHDVTSSDDWQAAIDLAASRLGGLSVLVNNAGISIRGSVEELSFDQWHQVMSVNTDSIFIGCKLALPLMRESQPGSIINLSSIAGLIASHSLAAYNASKAAVWLLSKSIALHCAKQRTDIRCNSVHPTFIRTPILETMGRPGDDKDVLLEKLARQVPLGRLGEPEDVGYAVVFLASDESRFITGAEIKLDGGISAM